MQETIIIAVGGNSLISDPKHVSVKDQYQAVRRTVHNIVSLILQSHRIVIVHGNGPQVGFILRRAELAKKELHMVPLDSCVADTQGALGYNIQMAVKNELSKRNTVKPVASLITQVIVKKNDPSFKNPRKPIGSFMDEKEALFHKEKDRWDIMQISDGRFRRVVASPEPQEIVELQSIRTLLENGSTVIACGGGGIPVIRLRDGTIKGVEAVIDKDLVSSLLAVKLNAERFIISTLVEKVCLNFSKPNQQALNHITVSEAESFMEEGHFAPGSMLPKIKACIRFIRKTGKSAIITNPPNLADAIKGKAGTHITP